MKNLCTLILLFFAITVARGQGKTENLKLDWPDEYDWKVGSNQDTKELQVIELIPKKEKLTKWTIMGTMFSYKGVKIPDINLVPNGMFQEAKKNSVDATLTVIEKSETGAHPWILFKIEMPGTSNPKPESQLFYAVQGDTALYSNFVALKVASLDDDFVVKWSKIFKTSELVYR
jgi:hypothetical protein